MTAIKFTSVSKKYTVYRHKSRSFQEIFVNCLKRKKSERKNFWVLKDLSFSVQPGESVALIGANGAGKSTTLKLISSIIVPDAGSIEINGRVSSLLELGTGFHPDLTGRENIYLNGSILGLSRKEIDDKYAEIIDFAEIEDYIDAPVKHYSSGMYLRLAFAVASHIEPDILLIDEVIAVGDHIFQQRCLKRLSQLKERGVTLVLVTHSLEIVQRFCERGIWLENGRIQEDGEIELVSEKYKAMQYQQHVNKRSPFLERVSTADWQRLTQAGQAVNRWGNGEIEITKVELLNDTAEPQTSFRVGDSLTVRMHYQAPNRVEKPVFGIALYQADGLHINGPNTKQARYPIATVYGCGYIDYTIEALHLLPGTYEVSVAAYDTQALQAYDHQHRLYRFQVLSGGVMESAGLFYLPSRWHLVPDQTPQPDNNSMHLEKKMSENWR